MTLVCRCGLGLELGDAQERVAHHLDAISDRGLERGDACEGLRVLGVRGRRGLGLCGLCDLRVLPPEIYIHVVDELAPGSRARVACVNAIDDVFERNEPIPRIMVQKRMIAYIGIIKNTEIVHCSESHVCAKGVPLVLVLEHSRRV